MKIYVAARFFEKERVRQLYRLLEEAGHEITTDWTLHEDARPYNRHAPIAQQYAVECIEGVKACDAFILLTNEQIGGGSSSELGAAIFSYLTHGKPNIYVVGEHLDGNVCHFHPGVFRKDSIGQVLQDLGVPSALPLR